MSVARAGHPLLALCRAFSNVSRGAGSAVRRGPPVQQDGTLAPAFRAVHTHRAVCAGKRADKGQGGDKRTDRKLQELKKSLLSDYKDGELSERQQAEWDNVEDAVRELGGSGRGFHFLGPNNVWTAGGKDKWPGFDLHMEDTTTLDRVDFGHLTTAQLQAHAVQLRAGFVSTPVQGPVDILRFDTRQYLNIDLSTNKAAKQGLQEAKVTLKFFVDDLKLPNKVRANLIELVSPRYNDKTDEVKLTSERFPSSKMNKEYLKTLLARLVTEARKLAEVDAPARPAAQSS